MVTWNISVQSYDTSDGDVTQWTLLMLLLMMMMWLGSRNMEWFLFIFLSLNSCINPIMPRSSSMKYVTTWYPCGCELWFWLYSYYVTNGTTWKRYRFRMRIDTATGRYFICDCVMLRYSFQMVKKMIGVLQVGHFVVTFLSLWMASHCS
jgi:hypothetical protein